MIKILASPKIILLGFILISFFVLTASASQYEEEISGTTSLFASKIFQTEELKPNEIYVRQLKGGEQQVFKFNAIAGNCLRFIIEQQGIDVMITINDTKGGSFKQIDRPNGSFGRETVTFFVPQTGFYTIEIKTWMADAIAGKYGISYTETDSPTETDRKRDLAENLTSEGEDLRGQGSHENKEKAIGKFSEALRIWQELGDVYEQAVVFYGMGYAHYGLSHHFKAALFYNRALRLHLEIGDEFGQAVNQAALGAVQYALSENEFAAYNYEKAIEIYKKMGYSRGLGISFHGLGTVEMLSKKYDRAIIDLTESLRWRVLANDNVGKARTHITLAKLYLDLNTYDKALDQLSEAERTFGETRAKKDVELLYYWGRYFVLTGQPDKAIGFLARGLDLSKSAGNKLSEANCLFDLSRARTMFGETENALSDIQIAVNLIETLRQMTPDFQTRLSFSATIQPFYEQYISLLMKMHEFRPEGGFAKKAFEISEQARARGLLDVLERRALLKRNPANPELLEREHFLRDRLTELLAIRATDGNKQRTAEIQTVSAQFSEVEDEINQQFILPEIVLPTTLKTVEIQDYLDEKTVLLEYSINSGQSLLWLVSKNEVSVFRLPSEQEINRTAKKIYNCFSRSDPTDNEIACRRENEKLSKYLLKPITQQITGKRLIVVKQGFLHYIPFASLINPLNSKYLIETNEILTLSSASLLSFTRITKSQSISSRTLAVFADPVYSLADGRFPYSNQKRNFPGVNNNFPRLFASRFEARRLSSFVTPENVLLKMDFEANRSSFFNADLDNYRILHFAAHTIINDLQPELSAIALSFFDPSGLKIPGLIRPNDILRLNLNADLVILSACQSGLGKQIKGEGILSLGQSFLSVGARRLIVSLWNVDDKVSAELMARFYRKHLLEKKNISVAFRDAQLEILHDKRWRSPFYWAGFVLQGDW